MLTLGPIPQCRLRWSPTNKPKFSKTDPRTTTSTRSARTSLNLLIDQWPTRTQSQRESPPGHNHHRQICLVLLLTHARTLTTSHDHQCTWKARRTYLTNTQSWKSQCAAALLSYNYVFHNFLALMTHWDTGTFVWRWLPRPAATNLAPRGMLGHWIFVRVERHWELIKKFNGDFPESCT